MAEFLAITGLSVVSNQFVALAVAHASVHTCRVEAEDALTLFVHAYQTALAAHGHEFVFYHDICRCLQRKPFVLHQTGNIMCNHCSEEVFAMARTRDAAGGVVSISAGTYYGAVSYAAEALVGHAAG